MLMQVLRVLVHLHEYGIVHRDLKPENILICKADSDELKVTDFGLSKTILATAAFLKNSIEMFYY